jgi:hypothetical protein
MAMRCRYELYDPMTLMVSALVFMLLKTARWSDVLTVLGKKMQFFFRNKHMMCDFGTGNNNKLNWVLEDKQELIDIIETIYRGAKKGRGLVVSPKGMCTWERTLECEGEANGFYGTDYSTRYRY